MIIKKIGLLLLSTLLSCSAFAEQTPQISQDELIRLMATPTTSHVILDVRTKEEYEQGHIAGAINISHDLISDNLTKLTEHQNKQVVVYCRSGRRAAVAENILRENGFNQLRHLTGDMNGWVEAKLPTVAGN